MHTQNQKCGSHFSILIMGQKSSKSKVTVLVDQTTPEQEKIIEKQEKKQPEVPTSLLSADPIEALRAVLPEDYYDDHAFYGREYQNSHFFAKSFHIPPLDTYKTKLDSFVTSFWYQTFEKPDVIFDEIEFDPTITISIFQDSAYKKKKVVGECQVIKHVTNPNEFTVSDICKILTATENIILIKYDDKLLYGFIRATNTDMIPLDIMEICKQYLNANIEKNRIVIKPVTKDWKWKYSNINSIIYNGLMDLIKDKNVSKCLFVMGYASRRDGNYSEDWDVFDVWWLLNDSDSSCILCRFHRHWFELDK